MVIYVNDRWKIMLLRSKEIYGNFSKIIGVFVAEKIYSNFSKIIDSNFSKINGVFWGKIIVD